MREKDLGIWQEISWSHYGEKAKLTGLALHTLGLEKGNVVSIASEGNLSGFILIWGQSVREEFLVECIQQTRLHRLSI